MTEPVSEPAGSAPTRRAVLDLLKRNGSQTVAQLGAALALSGVAVRRHLEVLEHIGLVQQTSRPQGRGRPAYVYALTEMGHDLFPRNYHQLVAQLLEAATSELGPEAVERLFDHRQQELAELYAGRTQGRPLPELATRPGRHPGRERLHGRLRQRRRRPLRGQRAQLRHRQGGRGLADRLRPRAGPVPAARRAGRRGRAGRPHPGRRPRLRLCAAGGRRATAAPGPRPPGR